MSAQSAPVCSCCDTNICLYDEYMKKNVVTYGNKDENKDEKEKMCFTCWHVHEYGYVPKLSSQEVLEDKLKDTTHFREKVCTCLYFCDKCVYKHNLYVSDISDRSDCECCDKQKLFAIHFCDENGIPFS